MAVGWPTKTTYANGDVYSASDVNDTNGTINLLTSTTLSVAGGKNRVVNGGMDWWQRGTSISVSASTAPYTADRWQVNVGANQATTVSRQATGDTTNLPTLQYALRYQRNSGQTGTGAMYLTQSFESVNSIPFAAQTVTLSFYARKGANYSPTSSIMTSYVYYGTGTDQNITGAYTGAVGLGGQNNTLTTTWQRFTMTVSIDKSATEIALLLAHTPTGTASTNDYYEITGVQLELGSVATTFSRAGGTIQGELAACQRYYWRTSSTNAYSPHGQGGVVSAPAVNIYLVHPVPMRVSPTSLDYSNITIYTLADVQFTVSALTLLTAVSSGLISRVQAGITGGTINTGAILVNNNTTAGYVGLSAEL
jgi:hypothetical protein